MRQFSPADILALIEGLKWTLLLVALTLAFGGPLALLVSLARSARAKAPRWIAWAYIEMLQGIPLLGLLMFFYFGLPVFLNIELPALVAVALAYALYTGAFLGEIWRGGIAAVRQAQWEAADCLGLSRRHVFIHVIAPQALRIALPATVGFLVQLIKNTSLASVVGFVELARAGQIVIAGTFQPLLTYSLVAVVYFALCYPLTRWSRSLEARFNGAG